MEYYIPTAIKTGNHAIFKYNLYSRNSFFTQYYAISKKYYRLPCQT